MLSLDKIYHARFVLKDVARKTDLIYAPKIDPESNVYLKTENLQNTGSFKLRGAYYKISQLSKEEKERGVIVCSAGNHALLKIIFLRSFVFQMEHLSQKLRQRRNMGRKSAWFLGCMMMPIIKLLN